MTDKQHAEDAIAALNAARDQLGASQSALAVEHLKRLAQQRVDDEIARMKETGIWNGPSDGSYVATVEWRPADSDASDS